MKTYGIRGNILLGFAAILLVLGLVAAIGTVQFLRTGKIVNDFADRHAEVVAIAKIERNLLSMREHVTNFAYFRRFGHGHSRRRAPTWSMPKPT